MLTILEGNRFLVADELGNITQGIEGLYADDTRYLSRWRLTLDGTVPSLLSAGNRHQAAAAVYSQHQGGSASHPSPLAAVRELFVSEGSFQEHLRLENHATTPLDVVVRYEFDADFLDLFEVKSLSFGERDLAFVKRITPLLTARDYSADDRVYEFSTRGHGFAASCLVWFSEAGVAGDREAHFEAHIPARRSWSVQANVVVLGATEERRRVYPSTYFGRERERVSESLRRWDAEMPVIEGNLERFTQI